MQYPGSRAVILLAATAKKPQALHNTPCILAGQNLTIGIFYVYLAPASKSGTPPTPLIATRGSNYPTCGTLALSSQLYPPVSPRVAEFANLPLPSRRLRHENCGAFESAGAQVGESLIGLLERIAGRLSYDVHLRGQAQKIIAILPCEIGDRQELPLFP